MKRSEAEVEVRKLGRTCRGPHAVTVAVIVAALAAAVSADRAARRSFLSHEENDPTELPTPVAGDTVVVTPSQDEALGEDAPSLVHHAHDHASAWFTTEVRAALEAKATV